MFLPASTVPNQSPRAAAALPVCELLDSDKIVDGGRMQFWGDLGNVAVLSKWNYLLSRSAGVDQTANGETALPAETEGLCAFQIIIIIIFWVS